MIDDIKILPADAEAMARAKKRWDSVSKPKNSLGDLEELIVRIAGAQGTENIDISRRVAVVFAADNGIVAERIAQSSPDLTAGVAVHIANGRGNINTMGRAAGCDVICVDVGIDSRYLPARPREMVDLHVMDGTRNFLEGTAMSDAEARKAFRAGLLMSDRISEKGIGIAAAGEMGIGNTTTSAAVIAALLNIEPREIVGRGAGLDDIGLARKIEVVRRGLLGFGLTAGDGEVSPENAWRVLCAVGGLDIAAMAGFYTGCASHHIPVVLDGLISAAAALAAVYMNKNVRDYLIASHIGREAGTSAVLSELGLKAVLHADMALGEGTGAVLLFPLLDVMAAEYNSALTFDDMGFVSDDEAVDGIRVFMRR
jgi:nicotinate-nucleotide--dimethylbenzimidazole phosphoribosyltransferase